MALTRVHLLPLTWKITVEMLEKNCEYQSCPKLELLSESKL
jgi:hypothetical protein